MYPELIDVVIYGLARKMENSGIEKIIKLLDGKISQVKYETQLSESEFLN